MGVSLCAVFVFGATVSAQQKNATNPQVATTDLLKTRLEERKTRLKTKLTAAESQRLSAKCQAAQQKIGSFTNGGRQALPQYQAYVDKIEQLEQVLGSNGTKSSDLLAEVAGLKEKYQAINKAVSDLNQAVEDLKSMDCKQDPAAFKASLEDARSLAVQVNKAQADFLQYIAQTVKPTLQSLKG